MSLEYQAVGFGSHHWLAVVADGARLFVTVDDLRTRLRTAQDSTDAAYARLASAFGTAYALRTNAGLGFVLAPEPDSRGRVLRRLQDQYTLVVHPFMAGHEAGPDGEFQADSDVRAVLELLVELHGASCSLAPADDFEVPGRDQVEQMLDERAVY